MWTDKLVLKDYDTDPFVRKININRHTDYANSIFYKKASRKLPLPRDLEQRTERACPYNGLQYIGYTFIEPEPYQEIKSILKRNSEEYFHGEYNNNSTFVCNHLQNPSNKSKIKLSFFNSKRTEKAWNQICPKVADILFNNGTLTDPQCRNRNNYSKYATIKPYDEYIIIERLSKTLKSKFNRRSWKQKPCCINRDYRSAYLNHNINNTSAHDTTHEAVKDIKEYKSSCAIKVDPIHTQSSYISINDKKLTLSSSKSNTIGSNKDVYKPEMSNKYKDIYNQESIRCLNIKCDNYLEAKYSKTSNEIEQSSDLYIHLENISYENTSKRNTKICCKCSDNKIYIQPTQPIVSSYSSDRCPAETKYCNEVCETPGNCLKQKSTEEFSKENHSQSKEKLHCLEVKTEKEEKKNTSNSCLNLKSKHESIKLGDKKRVSRKYLDSCPCKSYCETPKDLGSTSECPQNLNKKENTLWNNCLAIFLGSGQPNENAETSTVNPIENYMDSESNNKKCFVNPNKIKSPVPSEVHIVDIKSCKLNESDSKASVTSEITCNSSPSKRIIIIQESESKCSKNAAPRAPKNVEIYQSKTSVNKIPCSCDKLVPKIPSPKCSHKDNERLKALFNSHCQAMATITCALQDLACKAYYGTSEVASAAATLIQTEGAKQLEKIKNFKLPDDEVICRSSRTPCKKCRPKDCSNEEASENLTTFTHKISNIEIDKDIDDEVSFPKRVLDEIANKVESAISLVKDNININISDFLPNSFNDDSSMYDVPDKKFLKKKPEDISNVLDNGTSTSGNAIFKNIASKLMLIFDKSDAKCNETPDEKSNENGETIEEENKLREDDSTSSIPEAKMK